MYREVFENIGSGVTVADLTNSTAFRNNQPSSSNILTSFEAPTDILDNYGQRVRGWLVPAASGTYYFAIASDDASDLYLSTNDNPTNKVRICYVSSWTSSRQFNKEANQRTATGRALVAGQHYYIEALMKEGGGGDNLAVAWGTTSSFPDGTAPIPGTYLTYDSSPIVFSRQPTNTTVIEGATAIFTVGVSNFGPPQFQWQRNSNNIPGATDATFVFTNARLSDNGAFFRCISTNSVATNVTQDVLLTVLPDTVPPTLVFAGNYSATNVVVSFSEPVEPASAGNKDNYAFNGGIAVSSAALVDARSVMLAVSALTYGSNYTITVNNVRDTAQARNVIAANSRITFQAGGLTPQDVGGANPPGTSTNTSAGSTVVGGGADIGGTNDQFQFDYQLRAGDFDIRVRLASLAANDLWAKAGLMARETLNANSRFAAILGSPSAAGSSFSVRLQPGGAATATGSFPVNYPDTWLRLTRIGNQFTGFASVDGEHWARLGTAALTVGTVYLGFAVTSHDTNQTALAQFADLGPVTGGAIGPVTLSREPVGPSSRKTGLIISEIMYHPKPSPGVTNSLEFIELYNAQAIWENIGGYRISGSVDYTFPPNTVLPAGGYLVIARDPAFLQSHYGLPAGVILGPWSGASTNNLPNSKGTVRLRSRQDAVLLEVNYEANAPWPIAADGSGHSLVLARPSYGEGDPRAWAASDRVGGSPGAMDPVSPEPLRPVVINEFLAHSPPPTVDFIELYNHSSRAIDLSGAYLSDDRDTNKFRIPSATMIPAGGFVSFDETVLGFALSSGGGRIYLVNSNQTRVIDAVEYEAQGVGVASGRYPDGAPVFREMTAPTPGAPNGALLLRDIVINEIMYAPISGLADDEYVELYNKGTSSVAVGGWQFTAGINFTIPNNTVIGPNAYLVVARNMTNLFAHYNNLNPANTVGDFSGKLSGGGERLALAMPELVVSTNTNNVVVTNIHFVVVNEVTYSDGGRWGVWSDGGGSSLELMDPRSDNRLAANWADSDETAKSVWGTIEFTGNIDNADSAMGANDNIQLGLLDAGECLLDDVEVRNASNVNVLNNGNFEGGLANWALQGDHDQSSIENANYPGSSGSKCLHVRASARMDTGANRIRSVPPFTAAPSGTATLRARGRWLRGWPELLLRLHGNGLEASGRLPVPTNLGTPGAPNSRAVANAGPAIYEVAHSPILPAANESVVVTARVHDPDGVASLVVRYRLDPSATLSTVAMLDNGTGGDALAGDGIYSATIPGQASGALVAFHLMAVDNRGATNLFPRDALKRVFPVDADTRECLVRWDEPQPAGTFGTYHMFITKATNDRWTARDQLNNGPLDGTFVYNNYRVIYNMGPHYKGSPWHAGQMQGPTNPSRVDFLYEFPPDDLLLGSSTFALSTVGNPSGTTSSDNSGQSEQTSYIIFKEIGLHYNYRRYVHVFINGDRRSWTSSLNPPNFIMEDSQYPNGETVAEWYPNDPDGELYKIEDWFEFNDTATSFHNNDATLQRFTTTYGGATNLKVARYRHSWRKRAVSLQQSANDFTNLMAVVDAISPATNPTSSSIPDVKALDALINIEQWMRIVAVQHTVGNWDSYGYNRGKNCYAYRGQRGRFELMTWDIDFTVGVGGDGAGTSLFATVEPRMTAMWNTPVIARAYWRAFQDIINGPLNNSFMDPILDAKAAAFRANGVSYDPNTLATIKAFVSARRANIAPQLTAYTPNFSVTGTNFLTVSSSNLVTLSGVAPVGAKTIWVNGNEYPITWTSITAWNLSAPLAAGTNVLVVRGVDAAGNPLSNALATITVNYTGAVDKPQGSIVINEIMPIPSVPDAEYVELFNTSASTSFDLSGWRFDGLNFTFPGGSLLLPRAFLVLAKNRGAFGAAYGATVPIFAEFNGNLQANGETLTLVKPGATPAQDEVVDRVRYEAALPWPQGAATGGQSLQLKDATQDNSRVANWSDGAGWRFFSFTGVPGANKLIVYLDTAGELYLDDFMLVTGSVAGLGENLLLNGGFEGPLQDAWVLVGAASNTVISTAMSHSGVSSLRAVFAVAGSVSANISQTVSNLVSTGTYTLSFWYLPTTNANSVIARFGSAFRPSVNVRPSAGTPGTANSVAMPVAAFPPVWLNEVQAVNLNGIQDGTGTREPWVELYNGGTNAVPLDGLYLTDNYGNLTKWAFPAGASLGPKQFKVVFADGEATQTTADEWHTSFRLDANSASVALVRAGVEVLDYLNFGGLRTNWSYGSYPDGQPFYRQAFYLVTPGGTNDGTAPPLEAKINEWMADNVATLADPADGRFQDWFELYNPGTNTADLDGYYLTDNLTNQFQYRIPAGYTIPPKGHLLVWADGDTGQNSTNRPDLHVSFQLSKAGEAIGLFDANGQEIDAVTFGPQTTDVSQGRCPDGSASIVSFTSPSPRTANGCNGVNTAPVLASIGDQVVHRGQVVTFVASATDAETPPQVLTYSVDAGAPPGATMDPNSGLFAWNTTAALAPATNQVTVRVRDNGVPPLEDSETLRLVVLPPPGFGRASMSGTTMTWTYWTIPGKSYRVEYKEHLEDAVWLALDAWQVALGTSLTLTIDTRVGSQRFFRIAAGN